jgi:hypothetical protein
MIVLGSVLTRSTQHELSELDRALQMAMDVKKTREGSSAHDNDDSIHNENKNQGLINTIVNHNNKIKNIEHKFNLIINNYANSSHVKEVVEKTKEIEKHVFGAPRPHSSWREFLLVAIMFGMVVCVLIKVVKKYGGSWVVKVMSKKVEGMPRRLPSICELVPANHNVNRSVVDEFKLKLDQQLLDQNKKLENLMNVVNRERDNNNQPIRDA